MTDDERVAQAAVHLGEFFDSVRIICTKHDQTTGQTNCATFGVGNVHAQLSSCRGWVQRMDFAAVQSFMQRPEEL